MRTIVEQIALIKTKKKIGLMTHVVAGFPSVEVTEQLVCGMEQAGVDFVEIQIPFSDPLADGPTIMKANDRALENGMTTQQAFSLMEKLTRTVQIPLLFMGYYNTVFQFGVKKFCKQAQKVGAQGLIIPDMPLDEEQYEHFSAAAKMHNLSVIRVLSPTSTPERIALNTDAASGFIYCTAVAGTTGVRTELAAETKRFLSQMRTATELPLAVGFGISQPQHIHALIGKADIAVVGSAVITAVENGGTEAALTLVRTLVAAGI